MLGGILGLKQWGIPEALLAGSLGLLLAPAGLLPLLGEPVMAIWDQLPLPLLTLVFASLLLSKPLPKLGGYGGPSRPRCCWPSPSPSASSWWAAWWCCWCCSR